MAFRRGHRSLLKILRLTNSVQFRHVSVRFYARKLDHTVEIKAEDTTMPAQ